MFKQCTSNVAFGVVVIPTFLDRAPAKEKPASFADSSHSRSETCDLRGFLKGLWWRRLSMDTMDGLFAAETIGIKSGSCTLGGGAA
jgi:hypothetical protein